MAINKTCEHCKKEFRVTSDRALTARYCSQKCRTDASKHSATCLKCGTVFERYKSSASRMKYCSEACYLEDVKRPPKEPKQESPKYYKVCTVCAQTFQVKQTRKDTAKTCSRKCAGVVLAALYAEKREPRKCLTCGNEMKVSSSRAARGNGFFCSTQCANENAERRTALAKRGPDHYKWRGGAYESSRGYKYTKSKDGVRTVEHRIVALAAIVLSDPNHHFLVTDVNGNKAFRPDIEVHHIDRNRSNNSIENLLVVINSAHTKLHNSGKKPSPWECWPSNPEVW